MPNISAGQGLVLDSIQTADAQADGAVYDAATKKWDMTKRSNKK